MIVAVICGYFVRWMKTWKVNNTIQTIMPILIIPILTSLVLVWPISTSWPRRLAL